MRELGGGRLANAFAGFTLIELSIVLVIIGLVVGGVLVGQDLIRAARVRAQISQIERLNTAVNTFYGKFQALPGDMNPSTATTYNFSLGVGCDGSQSGLRNGDGLIQGSFYSGDQGPLFQGSGETALFWQDLSSSKAGGLIEGQFTGGFNGIDCTGMVSAGVPYVNWYFPSAKLSADNYIYVYTNAGSNWYGVSAVTSFR